MIGYMKCNTPKHKPSLSYSEPCGCVSGLGWSEDQAARGFFSHAGRSKMGAGVVPAVKRFSVDVQHIGLF